MNQKYSHTPLSPWHALAATVLVWLLGATAAAGTITIPTDPLVDTQWLHQNLHADGIRVIDLRGPGPYSLGHIEGAVSLPADSLFDTGERSNMVAPVSVVQEALSSAGIANNDIVVIYDDGSLLDAGRAFWVMELYGHKQVLVLNGGLPSWERKRLPVNDIVVKPARTAYITSIQPQRLATKFTTRLAVDNPNAVIVDARSTPEYLGEETHTARYGRIAHAINLPAVQTFEQRDGATHAKPLSEVQNMYSVVPRDKQVITYCTVGKKSAVAYLHFRRLGYNVSNYDGSWKEWGADPSLPIELGPPAPQPPHG